MKMEKFIKPDIWNNEKPEELPDICLEKRKQDRGKRMLRIDPNTYVLVAPEQYNPQYAEVLRAKFEKARKKYY